MLANKGEPHYPCKNKLTLILSVLLAIYLQNVLNLLWKGSEV